MEQPPEIDPVFRCPRCRHVEPGTRPDRRHCPRCGLSLDDPRLEREELHDSRRRLQLMQQPM
jgi:hypothetical protein